MITRESHNSKIQNDPQISKVSKISKMSVSHPKEAQTARKSPSNPNGTNPLTGQESQWTARPQVETPQELTWKMWELYGIMTI